MDRETRFHFTKTKLLGLPPPEAGRTVYYDANTPGLTLRITARGQRSFYFYRKVNKRPVRHLLGKFPEMTVEQARIACQVKSGAAAQGRDLQAERQAQRHEQTISGLFKFWLDSHAKLRNKTWREDENRYERYLQPWAHRKLSSLKKTDIQNLFSRVATERGLYAANRLLALIRAMFNKAPDIGFTGSNPTAGIKKFAEEKRDRFLNADDLRAFFSSLAEEPNPMLRDFMLVCLFTGARRSNVQCMRWEEIDFGTGLWRIPDTKSGKPVVVPLVAPVLELLRRRWASANGSAWVFPSWGKTGHIVEPKSAWQRIVERSGLSNVRPHDLRRSLGSWMAITGSSLPVVGRMLGHTQPTTTAIYARLSVDPVRAAAETAATAMIEAAATKERPSTAGGDL